MRGSVSAARPGPKDSLHSPRVKSRSSRPTPRRRAAIAVAALRCRQWLHFCALPLAGLGGGSLLAGPGPWLRALVGVAVAAGCLGCAYGVNAVAERRTDRSIFKNVLVGAPAVAGLASLCASLVAGLALLLACLLGAWALLACMLSLACGLAYSVGLAGKRVPVLGLLLNTGIFAPLMAVLLVPDAVPISWAHELAVFVLLLMQNQLVHELADLAEDRAAGAHTTARWLGARGTRTIVVAAGCAIPVASLLLAPTAAQALIAATLAGITTAIACGPEPARARAAHRVAACLGGALLWLLARG